LHNVKIGVALFSETFLKPCVRFYIPKCVIGMPVKMGTKAGVPEQLRKASFTHK
jgi:hypothetical protein